MRTQRGAFSPAAGLAVIVALSSCSARPRPIVALDDAFVATRPELSTQLKDGRTWGAGLILFFGEPIVVPLPLSQSPGLALDAAQAEAKRRSSGTAIVASPLVAKAIAEGGAWSGDPPLIVPEWPGEARPGIWSVESDPIPAYRAAGRAAGAYVTALAQEGGAPSCGIIYSEAPTRPRAALSAFMEAYAASSNGRSLEIRELDEESENAGTQETAPGSQRVGGKAEAAVAEILGADVRILLVALGPDAGAAIRAADRPGLAIGADIPYPEAPAALAFRIRPDDSAIGRAVAARLRAVRGTAADSGSEAVPALLTAEARAGALPVGKTTLKAILEESALRVKGGR
jgi:hypothetical protein